MTSTGWKSGWKQTWASRCNATTCRCALGPESSIDVGPVSIDLDTGEMADGTRDTGLGVRYGVSPLDPSDARGTMPRDDTAITPELLLHAYASGVFPMSESRDDPEVFWVDPDRRGVMPLDGFYASRSLRQTLRKNSFSITYNQAFSQVVDGCAAREDTWINGTIRALYLALHQRGGGAFGRRLV